MNNHEFTPENTYVYPEGSPNAGQKVCKICRRNAMQKHKGRPVSGDTPVGPWNRNKTHCAHGHEYAIWSYTKADGSRGCKLCLRNRRIKKTYGLSIEQFDALWEAQDGFCWICERPFTEPLSKVEPLPHVDHDHVTGAVRGLLCTNCNRALGLLEDDLERLQRAITYLGR